MSKKTVHFQTLFELCDYVRKNDIDVLSEDIQYLGTYEPYKDSTPLPVCNVGSSYFYMYDNIVDPYGLEVAKDKPGYTLIYEDRKNNLGPLEMKYVEDFSES